jgi:hypothetical protein
MVDEMREYFFSAHCTHHVCDTHLIIPLLCIPCHDMIQLKPDVREIGVHFVCRKAPGAVDLN